MLWRSVASALPAQPPVIPTWPVASESRVRVLSPVLGDKKQVGVAVAATRDTLSFRGEKQLSYVSIHTFDIRQLEITQGTHTRRFAGGLLIVGGAAVGAAIGAATWKKPSCSPGYLLRVFGPAGPTQQSGGHSAGTWRDRGNIGWRTSGGYLGAGRGTSSITTAPRYKRKTIMRFILTLCAAALVAPSLTAAQPAPVSDWPIAPGSRVRIVSPYSATGGSTTMLHAQHTNVRHPRLFMLPRTRLQTTITTPNVTSGIDIAAGPSPTQRDFALISVLVRGHAHKTTSGGATIDFVRNCLDYTQGATARAICVLGGLLGGFAGAAIGSRPPETWVPVVLPAHRSSTKEGANASKSAGTGRCHRVLRVSRLSHTKQAVET